MLNNIILQGRLTAAPELRRTQDGKAVTSFSLAVERDYKSNGNKETDFIDIVAWRKTAEFVSKYFSKGSMAVVSGRLQIRPWTDNNGVKRRSAEVIAEHVYFGAYLTKLEQEPQTGVYADHDDPDLPWNADYDDNGDDPDLPWNMEG